MPHVHGYTQLEASPKLRRAALPRFNCHHSSACCVSDAQGDGVGYDALHLTGIALVEDGSGDVYVAGSTLVEDGSGNIFVGGSTPNAGDSAGCLAT